MLLRTGVEGLWSEDRLSCGLCSSMESRSGCADLEREARVLCSRGLVGGV